MAQIDLKFATIYIKDGTSKTGAVDYSAGYPAGTTAITVDGFTGIINTGDTFTITGESGSPTHTVTGHTETAGNTTRLTFSTVTVGVISDNTVVTVASKSGAINHGAGYTSSDFTIIVDSITGIIATGSTFTIAGESGSPVHTVTGHSETSGNTTSITFTNALVGSIADNAVLTFAARTGAINKTALPIGTTITPIDGITGKIPVGARFTFSGESGTPEHTVTAHSETGSNTTSITFTPVTTATVADNSAIVVLPNRLEVNIGEGNLTYTEKREMKYIRNRGRLDAVMLGDEQPVEVSMNFIWETLTSSSGDAPTIEDAFKGTGEAVNWVTAGSDPCEPYAVDLEVVYTPPCSDVEMETITLRDFRYEDLEHNFKDAQVSVKGKCNVTEATAVRSTNTYSG